MSLTVFVIRHAEKPQPGSPAPGLGEDGEQDERSLTVRGWQRAGAWAALFGSGLSADYPVPQAIYAAATDRTQEGKRPSRRPLQTIVPLADRLGHKPRLAFAQGEEAELAAEVAALDGVVLISWEHKKITTALLPALLAGQSIAGVPTRWDPERFDVVFRLNRAAPGVSFTFAQEIPQLLAGDPAIPMSVEP